MKGSKEGWGRRVQDSSGAMALTVVLESIMVSQMRSSVADSKRALETEKGDSQVGPR